MAVGLIESGGGSVFFILFEYIALNIPKAEQSPRDSTPIRPVQRTHLPPSFSSPSITILTEPQQTCHNSPPTYPKWTTLPRP